MGKIKHFMYMPLTGLGLFDGYRGDSWLRNRLKVFRQFVVPSLLAQTNQNFTLWVSVRSQERTNKQIIELKQYLDSVGIDNVFTYTGLCFWDDKYPDKEAELRLAESLDGAMRELINRLDGAETVLMTIQPSDDCFASWAVDDIQKTLDSDYQAMGYTKGYICNYLTKECGEYNPKTNPPFYTIKFPKDVFVDQHAHMKHIGPYKSHEYVPDFLKYLSVDKRGFLVGCHFDNVSTHFDNPYAGTSVEGVLKDFGLENTDKLVIPYSLRRVLFHKLPHKVKRKLRYWAGDKKWILRPLFALIYNTLRA